jgi:hypothetical protein
MSTGDWLKEVFHKGMDTQSDDTEVRDQLHLRGWATYLFDLGKIVPEASSHERLTSK